MRKKLLIGALALILTSGLAWASGGDATPATTAKPELTIMGFWEFCPEGTSETLAFKWWGDAVGATIIPVHVPRPDYDVKMSTMLASREFPDIMHNRSDQHKDIDQELGPQGWFVNTSQQIKDGKMPNLKKLVDMFPGDILLYAPDGNSYMQPTLNMWGDAWVGIGFSMRAELLKKGGWDITPSVLDKRLSTVDGILDAFRVTYVELNKQLGEDPPKPIIHNRGNRGLMGGWPVRGVAKTFGTDIRIRYSEENIYEYGPATNNFKVTLEFLNTIYEEGILHPAWMTMSEEEQAQLDWREGRNGMWLTGGWGPYKNWSVNNPFPDPIDYSLKPPIIDGQRAKWRLGRKQNGTYLINANSENVAKAVEASDWTYGDEGAETIKWGPEGYAWVKDSTTPWGRRWIMNANGSYPEVDDELRAEHQQKTRKQCLIEGPVRMIPSDSWGLPELMSYYHPTESPDMWASMEVQNSFAAEWGNMGLIAEDAEPVFNFTPQELDEKLNLEAALNTYVDEELVKFIQGQSDFSTWPDFQKRIKDLGYEKLVNIYNTALDRSRKMM